MTIDRICGNCGSPISGDQEFCPKCPRPKAKKRAAEGVSVLLVVAVLASSLLLLSSSVVNVVNAPKPTSSPVAETPAVEPTEAVASGPANNREAAYAAAQQGVQQTYPGEQAFAEYSESAVQENGNQYTVTIAADLIEGTTATRQFYTVLLERTDTAWIVKEIKK